MPPFDPTLHLLCGKIASGKSTLAAQLADQTGGVIIREDDWLAALYGDQMRTLKDYARVTPMLRAAMGPHVRALLGCGVSVVLDFQANTVAARRWMKGIIDATGAAHELHVLDVPDALCLARLAARNAAGTHPLTPTPEQFAEVSRHHVPPTADEGFNLVVHRTDPDPTNRDPIER